MDFFYVANVGMAGSFLQNFNEDLYCECLRSEGNSLIWYHSGHGDLGLRDAFDST